MMEIKLTQGKVALVDDRDFGYLNQWKWHAYEDPRNRNWYAVRTIKKDNRRTPLQMHRVIMQTLVDMEVDHIDGNGLNNQRSNLRNCTHQQNMCNQRRRRNALNKYRGVSWHKGSKKWVGHIRVDGCRINLGSFNNEADAALAYNEAAIKHHGKFAMQNIIEAN